MKVTRMRTDHVALYVIHLIAVFAIGSSDNPLTGENNLKYNCSQLELSLHFSIRTIERNFISSPFITCLTLKGNQIQLVKNGAFDNVPTLEYLNMAGNEITDFLSFDYHSNLRTLILANQSIPNHDTIGFKLSGKYPELRNLDLSDNKIRSIDYTTNGSSSMYSYPWMENPFRVMQVTGDNVFPKLDYLDLSYNEINSFFYKDEHSLFNLNLTQLFLHNNDLNNLDLRYFKNLIILTADRNNIQSLERNYCDTYSMCVSDMLRLKYLSISNNKLHRINHDFFEFMPELAMLNLSNNQLTDNLHGVFHDLISLRDLNLDNNQLTNISLFKKPVQLSNLSVSQNKIRRISLEDFINTPNLRKLYLNNNAIRNIREEAFGSLELLKELHLADNELTNLPVNWSNNLKSLQYLDLANNKFMYLKSLSLSTTLPLISIDLRNNYITSFTTNILHDFPENVTIHLIRGQRNIPNDFPKKRNELIGYYGMYRSRVRNPNNFENDENDENQMDEFGSDMSPY